MPRGVTKSVQKYVRKEIKELSKKELERKFYIKDLSCTPSEGGTIIDLTGGIQHGDSDFANCHGDNIGLQQCLIRLGIDGTSTGGNMVRVILFQWKPSDNEDTPTIQELLSQYIVGNVYSHRTFDQGPNGMKKSNFLFDRTFFVQDGTSEQMKFYQRNVYKGYARKVSFEGSTMTTGNAKGVNKLFMLILSDASDMSTNKPIVFGQSEIVYTDA